MTARRKIAAIDRIISRKKLTCRVESECVVVSPEFLKHLKKLPEDVLSFNEAVEEVRDDVFVQEGAC